MVKAGEWLSDFDASPTLVITEQVRQLKAKGVKVINLVVGEPDFNTPEFIKDAVNESLKLNQTRYTDTKGIPELREAIVKKLKDQNNLEYKASQVIVTCGAKQAISTALAVLLDLNDECIIPSPYWVSYPAMVKIARGKAVIATTTIKDNYKINVTMLDKYRTSRTKALILNSPSNPTGVLYTREELKAITDWAVKYHITIISDEVYERIVFPGAANVATASISKDVWENTITINGLSKSHCMTGWRMGYACAPTEFIEAMANYQSHYLSHIASFVQYASIKALQDTASIGPMVEAYDRRAKLAMDLIKKHIELAGCVKPEGAFYLFPDFSKYLGGTYNGTKISNSIELSSLILQEGNVAVVPGLAFGNDEGVRISIAVADNQIIEGIEKIGSVLKKIKR
jgi:aspartate aminotransferase